MRRAIATIPMAVIACLLVIGLGGITLAGQAGLTLLDAAQITIAEQPSIRFQQEQVTLAQGNLQAAGGRFDMRFGGNVDTTRSASPLRLQDQRLDLTSAVTNQSRVTFGLDKPLRSGLIITPSLGLTRNDLEFDPLAANRAAVNVAITQPLWRGRGAAVVTAEESAARVDVDATTSDLRYTAALSVYQTAVAYWNYVAAYRGLEVVRASEGRARRLVEETQTLIDAGNRPSADIRQVNGNLAERIAFRTAYEQSVFEARQALGLAMGLQPDRAAALPSPADAFPAVADSLPPVGDPLLMETALASRADLEATRRRERGTQFLITSARDALKPKVDLTLSVGYAGLTEGGPFPGLFSSLADRLTGANFLASVVVDKSKENNLARGQLRRVEAAHRQTQIRIEDLSRSIRSAVAVAQDDLSRSGARARLLRDAAGLYGTAVEDERQKLQLGLSTIIDLVLIEDRLTRSLLEEIAATLRYASALARLRFETGTIIDGAAGSFRVTADALTTVPVR
jgi:outer membrane protein TolC